MSTASDEMAARIRALIGHRPGITERKMFGGVGFMLNGNMIASSTKKGNLMVRVGPGLYGEARRRPGASAMHIGAKEMVGFLNVTDEGIETDEALKEWIDYAEAFVKTLPSK